MIMKKYIFITIAVLTLAACNRDEKNLFDQSAAERVEQAQREMAEALVAAPNGWEMRYFPIAESAGYAFLMDFKADGSVRIAAKNHVTTSTLYKEEISAWGTDGTQGAILTFNTFNTIFHKFADPADDGLGYQGDYEFVCLSTSENQILLKGKKHGAYITMNRLSADQDWREYFQAVDKLNEVAFLCNDGVDMTYVFGDSTLTVIYDEGTFTYKKGDKEITRSFILTPTGLHFYTGVPYYGDTTVFVQDFHITGNRIQSELDPEKYYILSNYTAANFYDYKFSKQNRWVYTAELSDQATQDAVSAICDKVLGAGAEISSIAYEQYAAKVGKTNALYIAYLVEGKLLEAQILLNYKKTANQITYSYKSTNANAKALLARIDADETVALSYLTDIFCGTFEPETAISELNKNKIYLHKGDRTLGVTIDNQLH